MAELANNELLVLNTVLGYKVDFSKGRTVSRLIEDIETNLAADPEGFLEDSQMTQEEVEDFIRKAKLCIQNNSEFGKYTIIDRGERIENEIAPIVAFANGDSVVVVFWGTTGPEEWADNVIAGYSSVDGSKFQKLALEFVNSLPEKYKDITVTGHSKGGNKAQYVALMSDRIDRCVAFDGQGFSFDFIEAHADKIRNRKDIITLISSSKDIVNALLFTIAGTVLYVDSSEVPDHYIGNFFHYHKPGIMLDENGDLYTYEDITPMQLVYFVHGYSKYMSSIEDDEHRRAAFEFGAKIVALAMGGDMNKERIRAVLKELGNMENTEGFAYFLAYTFEFAEKNDLTYQELLAMLEEVGIDSNALNAWYMPLLWEALFDVADHMSVEEFVSLCKQVQVWANKNDISTWEGLLDYIMEDPFRIIELYSSLDLDKETVNKAISNFLSTENISKFIGTFIKEHPVISAMGTAAFSVPVVRAMIAKLAAVVAAIGVVALTVNHIIQNWDKICEAFGRLADYVKDEVAKFYNAAKQYVSAEINKWISNVCCTAETYITKGSRIVNTMVDVASGFFEELKKQAVAAVKSMLLAANPLFYVIASKVYRAANEPVRINVMKLSDCVDRMNRLATRVAAIDERLDRLYSRLARNNIEMEKGVFTSLANMYHLFRADLNVDEGAVIKRRARALSDLYDGYVDTDKWVKEHAPGRI